MSDELDKGIGFFESVSVVISPHDKGFTCGVIDPKGPHERDICSYIAKGLVRFVRLNPDLIYEEGMQAFYEDDAEKNKLENGDNSNVIDLFNWKKGDLN
mgnify:CR=1 FL=1|tara:strand:- start:1039 stop:1335 length:297 start_codon:yes stop_codon:yes gene_type:complete